MNSIDPIEQPMHFTGAFARHFQHVLYAMRWCYTRCHFSRLTIFSSPIPLVSSNSSNRPDVLLMGNSIEVWNYRTNWSMLSKLIRGVSSAPMAFSCVPKREISSCSWLDHRVIEPTFPPPCLKSILIRQPGLRKLLQRMARRWSCLTLRLASR